MARISRSASWTVPYGDFGALRLTAEVFMAHCGIPVQVRNGGTIIGQQGSSLAACLFLLYFAPVRLLPKRVRLDVVEEQGLVRVQALLDGSLAVSRLNGLVARRYTRQFDDWLSYLQGQVLPADVPQEDEVAEPSDAVHAAVSRSVSGAEADAQPELMLSEVGRGRPPGEAPSTPVETAAFQGRAGIDWASAPRTDHPSNSAAAAEAASKDLEETSASPTLIEAGTAAPTGDEAAGPEQVQWTVPQAATPAGDAGSAAAADPAPPRRRRLRLPSLRFGRRGRASAAPPDGLPEPAGRELAAGDAAFKSAAWAQAVAHYDGAIKALGSRPGPNSPLASAAGQLFYKRASALFAQAQTSLDSLGPAPRSVSDYQIAIEPARQAIADYGEAIRLGPRSAAVYYRRGEAHLFAARCERGTKSYRRASEELHQAVADLSNAVSLNAGLAPAFALRAVAQSLLGREREAEADVGRAIDLGTDAASLRRAIGASKSW